MSKLQKDFQSHFWCEQQTWHFKTSTRCWRTSQLFDKDLIPSIMIR